MLGQHVLRAARGLESRGHGVGRPGLGMNARIWPRLHEAKGLRIGGTAPDERSRPASGSKRSFNARRDYLPAERLDHRPRGLSSSPQTCHEGQTRRTGDPYITHPVAVTYLVADLELDHLALAAALLHDVQEDCGISNETHRREVRAARSPGSSMA